MEHNCSDLEKAVRETGLSHSSLKRTLELLENLQDIPRLMALKLLRFLQDVKVGRFQFLSTVEKTALLENFHYVMRGEREGTVSEICHLFFEQGGSSHLLPRTMRDALVDLLVSSRTDVVREITWRVVAGREPRLASLVSPQQVISALWSENPIFRNNVVEFLFHHFTPAQISTAISHYTAATGKTLCPEVLKRVIAMGGVELEQEKKKWLLTDIMKASDRRNEAIEEIWSDFLKGLSRFDRIRAFQDAAVEMSWAEELKKSYRKHPTKSRPQVAKGFPERIAGIRKNAHQSLMS